MRTDHRIRLALTVAGATAVVLVLVLALALENTSQEPGPPSQPAPPTTAPTTTAPTPPSVALPGPDAQLPPGGLLVGANVNRLFENPAYSAATISTQLGLLRASGAPIARENALWDATEPTPPIHGVHRYDWTFDDRIATALATHGLQWLAIIDYSPGWAKATATVVHAPPSNLADYAAYAAAFAARYGSHGAFWATHPGLPDLPVQTLELWNEPDNPVFWGPSPDPARYAQLYLLTRATVLRAQPDVRVVVGGLWHPDAFLSAMVAAAPSLVGHVDGVAVHPYAGTPAGIVANVRKVRHVLAGLHLARVPLYVTEFGWTTSPPGALNYLPAALRPGYLEATLALLGHLSCGIAAITAYTWVTERQSPADSEQWYGISAASGSPGPDATAFAAGVRDAANAALGTTTPC